VMHWFHLSASDRLDDASSPVDLALRKGLPQRVDLRRSQLRSVTGDSVDSLQSGKEPGGVRTWCCSGEVTARGVLEAWK